ncbi:MAG: hypothetical protein ACREOC_09235 [Gemmatimonadales bacterium]
MDQIQHGGGAASCDLSILVARIDTPFMLQTIPHLVRSCRFPFARRVLVVDTAPLGRRYRRRPNIGTAEELNACCTQLLQAGVMDAIMPIDYSPHYRRRTYQKHFTGLMRQTHSSGGYPILGSIFAIEESRADFLVHFDSDMLLYQDSGFSWIEEGIKLLRDHPDLLAVLPRSGPSSRDGRLRQQEERGQAYEPDVRGIFSFKTFTSRVFLIERRRFERLLPLRPPLPVMELLRNYFTARNTMPEWEVMVGSRLRKTGFVRAELMSPRAWTLHPEERGQRFEAALPNVIARVEAGYYPAEQGGYYDLLLDHWT